MRVLVCGLLAATLVLGACGEGPAQPRKAQMVKLLPDTPPPPPPPPKPEDRPPPKPDDAKPVDVPKPAEQPAQQALKSDEAAGDGPGNGLAAGAVTHDYSNQALSQGQVVGGAPAESGANRLAANSFATATTRALNDYLARDRDVKRLDYQVRVDLWLEASGSLRRAELVGSSGDAQTDEALREALTRFPGAGGPLPARLPQPLRLRITNRMMG